MHRSTRPLLDRTLLQAVDGCLAGVIFAIPWLMGGRHAVGQLALTILAVAAAWAWGARQWIRPDAAWRWTAGAPLLALGLGLVLLQLAPLPAPLLAWLSPHHAAVLPLWNVSAEAAAPLGAWTRISFVPQETQSGLVLFLDYALLFLVAAQRIRQIEDVERVLRWCAASASLMAIFGIVQLLTSNGQFFWCFQSPFTDTLSGAMGSFTNRNHFAHFMALGVGPAIWRLQDVLRRSGGTKRARFPTSQIHAFNLEQCWAFLAVGIILFGGFLSCSRGGIAVLVLATCVSAAVCFQTSPAIRRSAAAFGFTILSVGIALEIFGGDLAAKRLADFTGGSLEHLDRGKGRRRIWEASLAAISDYKLLGAGVGSFREVYPTYTDSISHDEVEYTHAENCYLQVAVETGLAGLGLVLAGIGTAAAWCIRGLRSVAHPRLRTCAAAISASLAAAVVHAAVDFVWYVPACIVVVFVLAACAFRVAHISRRANDACADGARPSAAARQRGDARHRAMPRRSAFKALAICASLAVAVALALASATMVGHEIGPAFAQPYWDNYLMSHYAMRTQPREALADAALQQRWRAELENVLYYQPSHARAHLALAETHRWLFEISQRDADNAMSVAHIRDAAVRSQFPSPEAVAAWMSRAFGKDWEHLEAARRHAELAVRLCPLSGRGYVYLAELAFLTGKGAAFGQACTRQSLRVRPYDGAVLCAAATEAILAGDAASWQEYSKQALRVSYYERENIIYNLVAGTADGDLPALMDCMAGDFLSDVGGLRTLRNVCVKRCSPEQMSPLTKRLIEQLENYAATCSGHEAAARWSEASGLHREMNNGPEALRCAQNALQSDPGLYETHYCLGVELLRERRFADAETQWRWCRQRRPNDESVGQYLRDALKGRIEEQTRNAAANGVRRQ